MESEQKTERGGSQEIERLRAFASDSNFQGAFVGGPPLLSSVEVQRILDEPGRLRQSALAVVGAVLANHEE